MTDRDLLERAAKAAGLELTWRPWPAISRAHPREWAEWNPLADDGDALRLAVQLRFAISIDSYVGPHGFVRVYATKSVPAVEEPIGHDARAATRRAIVRAAAEVAGHPLEEFADVRKLPAE